ncbi:MAG: aldo/keto reductase [Aeromicrobium sp.]|uniref:aldo/keto reductase n=1 Tax=Aeromicrobium sp. TaxID=1871063 RepID=UPI0039E31C76
MSTLSLSPMTLGCLSFGSRLDEDAARAVVDAALDAGVTSFDTADAYGVGASEEILGRVLAGRRDEVVIATKFGMTMEGQNGDETARSSPAYIRRAVEASLRRLGVDRIDLYQWHTPDRVTPFADTIGALTQLVDAGLVGAIGVSNLTGAELSEALAAADAYGFERFVTTQNDYSLYHRGAEDDLAEVCLREGVGLMPYFPLAQGLLGGAYQRGKMPPPGSRLSRHPERLVGADWDLIETLEAHAADLGMTLPEMALGYLAARHEVESVVVGATTPEQVAADAEAVDTPLPDEAAATLAALPRGDRR